MTKKKDTREGAESAGTAGSDPAIAALSYEDAMAQLEALVERIEQGEVGLEESLASYRRGEQLLRHLKGLLDRAETTVRDLSLAEVERGGDRAGDREAGRGSDRADHF
ncbi:MAG: exodeoxyribonuclease VII small subunit [Planctomycetaceae bacterium]|nr:exodeoxyribonuclease VII small subunit [Planctomycetaceae bacterium]